MKHALWAGGMGSFPILEKDGFQILVPLIFLLLLSFFQPIYTFI